MHENFDDEFEHLIPFPGKAKEYELMKQCLEDGVKAGYERAHKHTDKPTKEHIANEIVNYVTNNLHEWFRFE